MSTEGQNASPASQAPSDDPVVSAGLGIAAKWGGVLDAAHLEVALKALEPQLRREHKERLLRLELQREAAEHERAHKQYMAGLITGGIVAIVSLGAGVFVAKDFWWLSILLCGPSLLALVKLFVLRRSDEYDMKAVSRVTRSGMSAVAQAQPPQPPAV
ncbi:hypothetical protein AB0K80_26750 [Streptomyces sp. NPDC052682]|uniref:hypothetical protein n=1 Tax=Streptomyces sp. NPDC052682 TaxID=3154954 RepID=UPI0034494B3F